MARKSANIVKDLMAPISRTSLVPEVQKILGVPRHQAEEIVRAFDVFVAEPLEANLQRMRGRDLAKRNPMIYTARGVRSAKEWIERVLSDKETSAIEAHLGTFLEEVARIVSGGIKPGSGVDLQAGSGRGTVRLYAIQSSPTTKNAGSRRSDIDALKRAARPLRASRRIVELHIAVLWGQTATTTVRAEPDVTILASDEFWDLVSGVRNFRERLFRASIILSTLVRKRASDDVARITEEAIRLYADEKGELNLDALTKLPDIPRSRPASEAPATTGRRLRR